MQAGKRGANVRVVSLRSHCKFVARGQCGEVTQVRGKRIWRSGVRKQQDAQVKTRPFRSECRILIVALALRLLQVGLERIRMSRLAAFLELRCDRGEARGPIEGALSNASLLLRDKQTVIGADNGGHQSASRDL